MDQALELQGAAGLSADEILAKILLTGGVAGVLNIFNEGL